VGTTATLVVTITNPGTTSVSVAQNSLTGSGFSTSGIGSGVTLSPNQSTTLEVQFNPAASGSVSGTVSLSSSISGSPVVIALSGAGVAVAHSVTLSWNSESGVVGFNVYRSSGGSDPGTMLNTSPVASTTYTDATVQAGQSYSYAVSAIGADGVQSALSQIVSVTIP
jgi:Abnormal spindle-like microcephaly-assoc'd, ASPM-SPD-2-Hydin